METENQEHLDIMSYVVITPVRNEAEYIQKTLDCMSLQTRQPAQWIIVNDGSTDDTAEIVAAGSHGFNAHCVVVDELHTQPSRDLYDVLRTSMASRRQPLMISITTAGWDRESICHEVWSHARHVRDTREDPHFLPVIYEAQDDEDWQDEQTWRRCNPCYGVSVSAQYLEEAYQRAVATPSFETTFKNLHLNLWTDSAETWLGSQSWAECRDELPNLDGRECFAALDLGATDDLTALVYALPIDGKLYIQCRVCCATATVREAKRSYQSQYRSWADRGWLTLTPGKQTDYDEIIRTLAADAERYRIVQVGYDQWNAADLAQKLQDHYGLELVKIPQTCAGLNMGTRTVEEAVASRSLVHDCNPILAWAVSSSWYG